MKIIGIDIGTTTISGVVLEDKDAQKPVLLEAKTVENGCFIPDTEAWEKIQDAGQIVERAERLLNELLNRHRDVRRIGLTGQMHGIVYLDRDGKSISPLYTWQDARGNLPDENQMTLIEEIRNTCGIQTAAGYGIVTHIYNKRHHLVPEGAVSFCTIMDYFGMHLTGRKEPLVHASNAAGFGFFDSRHMHFDTESLLLMGVEKSWLPEVCTQITELGTYRDCMVTTAIGDNQASFLGAAGKEDHTILVNMGTGGQISVLSEEYFSAEGIEARPFLNGKYLLAGASLCGGKAYALLEQFFEKIVYMATGNKESLYGMMEQLAQTGKEWNTERKEDRKLKITTAFDGTRVNPEASGNISNLFSDNFTPEFFTYGVLEGMSRELYQMYQVICRGTGEREKRLIGSGNGLRKNPVLCKIIEEMFDMKVTLADCEEEAATGAALSSMLQQP